MLGGKEVGCTVPLLPFLSTFPSILKSHERSATPIVVWEYLFEPLRTGKIRIPLLSKLSWMLYSRMKRSDVTSDDFSPHVPVCKSGSMNSTIIFFQQTPVCILTPESISSLLQSSDWNGFHWRERHGNSFSLSKWQSKMRRFHNYQHLIFPYILHMCILFPFPCTEANKRGWLECWWGQEGCEKVGRRREKRKEGGVIRGRRGEGSEKKGRDVKRSYRH